MAQQTAVNWLEDVYNTQGHILPSQFEQAKQIEKEQKIGLLNWILMVSKVEPMRLETDYEDIVEQYYNETYKNK